MCVLHSCLCFFVAGREGGKLGVERGTILAAAPAQPCCRQAGSQCRPALGWLHGEIRRELKQQKAAQERESELFPAIHLTCNQLAQGAPVPAGWGVRTHALGWVKMGSHGSEEPQQDGGTEIKRLLVQAESVLWIFNLVVSICTIIVCVWTGELMWLHILVCLGALCCFVP